MLYRDTTPARLAHASVQVRKEFLSVWDFLNQIALKNSNKFLFSVLNKGTSTLKVERLLESYRFLSF